MAADPSAAAGGPTPAAEVTCPVSVIVIVKNDRGIASTLSSLQQQAAEVGAEVIVVDASQPHVLADICAAHPDVRWLAYPPSSAVTIPQQRNVGLGAATGRHIVFLDANCTVGPRWLQSLLESFARGESIVCGPVVDRGDHHLVRYFDESATNTYMEECTTQTVGLTREVLAAVGEFDEGLPYGEDVDYFWRARDAGFRINVCPEMRVLHDAGSYSEQLRRAYRYGRSRAILYRKHWRRRWRYLCTREQHVVAYPVYLIGLPLAFVTPWYLALPLIPVLKNRSWTLVLHHLVFGVGVLAGAFTRRR